MTINEIKEQFGFVYECGKVGDDDDFKFEYEQALEMLDQLEIKTEADKLKIELAEMAIKYEDITADQSMMPDELFLERYYSLIDQINKLEGKQ